MLHNVKPDDILVGVRTAPVVYARRSAFAAVFRKNPDYSVAGLARVSGFHHTTILNALGRC